jgi:hypothetical protein
MEQLGHNSRLPLVVTATTVWRAGGFMGSVDGRSKKYYL